MKTYRFPRWLSTVAFAIGKPAFWFWNATGAVGRFLLHMRFAPARFTCHACGKRQFGVRVFNAVYYNEASPRICTRCYDDVPF